jgi:hypothetical protein
MGSDGPQSRLESVAVFAGNSVLLRRLRDHLPQLHVQHCPQLAMLRRHLGSCPVLIVAEVLPSDLNGLLLAAARAGALGSVIVVTRRSPEHDAVLAPLTYRQIVWWQDFPERVSEALGLARGHRLLDRFAAHLESAANLPPDARVVLGSAIRNCIPIRCVDDLATALRCDRTTVWRRWRAAGAPLSPGTVIDWILLLNAAQLRTAGSTWAGAAARLTVHEHTLARTARRLLGCGLRGLREMDLSMVVERAERALALPTSECNEPA